MAAVAYGKAHGDGGNRHREWWTEDYSKCFECLGRTREIADEWQMKVPDIYQGLGCMYLTVAEETDNDELRRERCYLLRDTLTNYHQLASVSEMEFTQELH